MRRRSIVSRATVIVIIVLIIIIIIRHVKLDFVPARRVVLDRLYAVPDILYDIIYVRLVYIYIVGGAGRGGDENDLIISSFKFASSEGSNDANSWYQTVHIYNNIGVCTPTRTASWSRR